MKSKTSKEESLFGTVVGDLESQLSAISSQSLRILEKDGSLVGVCFLSKNLSSSKREAVERGILQCKDVRVESSPQKKVFAKKITLLPQRVQDGCEDFSEKVAETFQRSVLTRIPFAVLLFQWGSCKRTEKEIATLGKIVKDSTNSDEIFCRIRGVAASRKQDSDRFAAILPSAGLSKARRRAEEIQALFARSFPFPCAPSGTGSGKTEGNGLSIGLGVSYVGDHPSVESFLNSVEKSMAEALLEGGGTVRWQQSNRSGNTCQVTAEERAQLFGFLK